MSLQNLPSKNPSSAFSAMRGHHVALRVPDYEVEKRWYTEKLDFRVVHEWLPVIHRRLAFFADPFGNLFELAEVLG
jgi:glyoxylase I family protein